LLWFLQQQHFLQRKQHTLQQKPGRVLKNATLATASNWEDDTAPQSGDILVFPHDSKATNNLAANIAIAGISVEGSGESYTALEINGSGVLNLHGSISGVVF
jgi:hypothetical protein